MEDEQKKAELAKPAAESATEPTVSEPSAGGTAPSESAHTESAAAESAPRESADAVVSADEARVVLRRVKDPELNLNIVDLGLIYDVFVEGAKVRVDMSLTSPGCPSGPEIMGEAEQQLRTIPGVTDVEMNLVWSPPWTPERIEPRVRAYMGF